jgi:protein-tyrosine phosphatase
MAALIPSAGQGKPLPQNGSALYRAFPTMLAPHLRLLFATLLRREGPVEYNCSAGQDRTGFASAMILSALGVPRATILEDYDLSTRYRQPRYEMPPIDARLYPGNAAAALFAQVQASPAASVAQPLREADGTPFLAGAFAAIEERWGSVDRYLEQEIGLRPVDIAALRAAYLE